MIAGTPLLDLDDVASVEAADSGGSLRSAASGGAQVRATAAAVAEGALARLRDLRPRSLVLVSGSGSAARAAGVLVAGLADRAGLPIVVTAAVPPWVGALDVVLVAGDDAGDPRLIEAVDHALRRGAEVVVAAPDEGPLRAAAAGRAVVLPPRVPVRDQNRMLRYLAVGLAVLAAVDQRGSALIPDLDRLAEVLDAEALRDGPANQVFHNPAKSMAARMQQHRLILAGDSPAATQVARHGAEVLLATAGEIAAATALTDAVAARARLDDAAGAGAPGFDPLFHDEELDGPAPVQRARVFVLSTDPDQSAARRRLAVFGVGGLVDADLVTVEAELPNAESGGLPQRPDAPGTPRPDAAGSPDLAGIPARGNEIELLAVLALRLEMTAAYVRLLGGPSATADRSAHYDGGHF